LQRTIGKPGGYQQGPFDSNYLTPAGRKEKAFLAIDANGKLWITETGHTLKRISRWTQEGVWERDYYGNTRYGGGGTLDVTDKRRAFFSDYGGHQTLEFGLDWKTGKTKLNAIAWLGDTPGGEYAIPIDGRLYLVTRPHFGDQDCGFVYLYEGKKGCRRVAAVGPASGFKALQDRSFYSLIGNRVLGDLHFTWSDANGDGNPQRDEVSFFPGTGKVSWFDEQLGINGDDVRYEVGSFRSDGAPVYRAVKASGLPMHSRRMTETQTLYFNERHQNHGPYYNSFVDAKGETSWNWETEGRGVHAYYSAGPFTSRQVVAEFDVIGTSRGGAGELGDIFVTNTNTGTMHIWTYDGILAGSMFQDIRSPIRKGWSTAKPERGLEFKHASLSQEHFGGWFGKTNDGKHYVVFGFNMISIAEVVGLEKARRVTGTLTITPADLRATYAWEKKRARKKSYEQAKVYRCPMGDEKRLDGDLRDWKDTFIHPDGYRGLEFAMHVGKEKLYLAYRVAGSMGPFLNKGGSGWQRYFKTGGAVDLLLGTDPFAKPGRKGPVKGDLRLLFTRTEKGPQVVLYQPTVDTPNPAEAWQAKTMVFTTNFDRVIRLKSAKVAFQADEQSGSWVLEAAVPLTALGLKPQKRQRLKFDFGLMKTNQNGNEVMQRIYWANQSTNILSDAAAEAALEPGQWGHVIFQGKGSGNGGRPSLDALLPGEEEDNDGDKKVTEEELLKELEKF
jgi:hypothetical protein